MLKAKILVPTDFSELSRRALRLAAQWVGEFGGRITPMHAYEPITDLDGYHFFGPKGSIKGNLPAIEAEVVRALDEFAGSDVEPDRLEEGKFVLGQPATAIAKTSLEHELVVISSHGRSGFSRFFLGSIADKVMQLSPTPVLVVHEEPELTPLTRVIVTTDLSENSAAALTPAYTLAEAAGATLELVHVHETRAGSVASTREIEERLVAFAAEHSATTGVSLTTTALVTHASVQEALVTHLNEAPANLVVMATAGNAKEHRLLGNAPARVVRAVRTPALLVAPENERSTRLEAIGG